MNLYHILVNERGEAVFAQRESWGEYSVCMHALMTGDIKSVAGYPNVYCGFWNPANPHAALVEGCVLFFLEAESLVEAISKVGPIWWSIPDLRELRRSPMVSGAHRKVSQGQYQQVASRMHKRFIKKAI